MFERYTEKARRAVFFSRYEASQDGSPYIEMEHLLAGLMRESKSLLDPYLTRDRLQEFVAALHKLRAGHRRPEINASVDLPLANTCKRALAYAAEESELLSQKHIGTEHLLLGMLREESSFPSLLTEFGITLETVRNHLKLASSEAPPRFGSNRIPPVYTAEARHARSFAEGCLEIVDTGGNRLAIVGLTATAVIPRIGEFLQLVVEGSVQKYRVVDVNYCYKINTPNSEYRVHHLSAVQVWVCPRVSAGEEKIVPDST
jgi:hypothetical protein